MIGRKKKAPGDFFEGKESLPKEGCQATKWMKGARGQKEHVSKNRKKRYMKPCIVPRR